MPSTQTPPLAGAAIDPPSLRPPIDDASIERVEPSALRAHLEALKAAGWTLIDIGGVDYLGRDPRFDVVYHFMQLPSGRATVAQIGTPARARVLCGVAGDPPTLPTAMDLWKSADWAEREIFDLFGIAFDGHADLRRIQMPYDWEGHPLRKDYPMRGPARERSPRPQFALKSNVQAGTPPSGRTLEALQEQVKRVREGASE